MFNPVFSDGKYGIMFELVFSDGKYVPLNFWQQEFCSTSYLVMGKVFDLIFGNRNYKNFVRLVQQISGRT